MAGGAARVQCEGKSREAGYESLHRTLRCSTMLCQVARAHGPQALPWAGVVEPVGWCWLARRFLQQMQQSRGELGQAASSSFTRHDIGARSLAAGVGLPTPLIPATCEVGTDEA